MILLQASHITKSFGATPILTDVTLTVKSGERVGLVGVNGAGKSTLMKIMVGELTCDSGEIIKPKDIRVGYLSQDSGLESDKSIYQELISVFQPLIEMEHRLRNMEKMMADPTVAADKRSYSQLCQNYSSLSEDFKEQGGYSYHSTVRSLMHGLNIDALGKDTLINNLSGGQKTLVALAKLLLQSPDVLMLDEPTNYLDINTLDWLEQYLKSYPGAILVVSHDRYLLDSLVNVIYRLENNKITRYKGNYTRYLELAAQELAQKQKLYAKQVDEVARIKDFVQRNIARASTAKRAQSRRRMLEKMDLMDRPEQDGKNISFKFNVKVQSGKEVLEVKNLSIGYGHPLASNINFLVERGESIAVVGPNGVGKSTLLKNITGQLHPLFGHIRYGTKVQIAYYQQEQAKLTGNKQVLHELWDEFPRMDEKDIRTVLGNFLFTGEEVLKTVNNLSGGEKARLALSKVLLRQGNLLILDEPTNHLDIYSRQVLEEALINFPGTILFVSHDRYFINRVATRVLELSRRGVTAYLGDYDYYIAKKQELEKDEQATNTGGESKKIQQDKQKYLENKEIQRRQRKRQRRIEQLEELIAECENEIAKLEQQLELPTVYQDHNRCLEINGQIEDLKTDLEKHLVEWINLEEETGIS
ncbi:ABC-F family ATP-binding cassette domain-containing protein [Desulfofalx alkaliphila]|uniref:ABC-F family ATP-binding cassette domain-containing protein n=1 Tax=Desulfofalx alkaliphila TaxID=105483 RepID=UPI0004E27DB7|nr:ABC-F family ATP-binding cassette domain-containing protein [Desulfofalx alkaliphila]